MKDFGFMKMCVQGIPGTAAPHLIEEYAGPKSIDTALPGTYPTRLQTHPLLMQYSCNTHADTPLATQDVEHLKPGGLLSPFSLTVLFLPMQIGNWPYNHFRYTFMTSIVSDLTPYIECFFFLCHQHKWQAFPWIPWILTVRYQYMHTQAQASVGTGVRATIADHGKLRRSLESFISSPYLTYLSYYYQPVLLVCSSVKALIGSFVYWIITTCSLFLSLIVNIS